MSFRWKDDDEAKNCFQCSAAFTLITKRKHHCRMCGYIFCSSCTQKVMIPKEKIILSAKTNQIDFSSPQLCCKLCIETMNSNSSPMPQNSGRQTERNVKITESSTTVNSGSNLNNFSPVESLLALSNQVTMMKIDKKPNESLNTTPSKNPPLETPVAETIVETKPVSGQDSPKSPIETKTRTLPPGAMVLPGMGAASMKGSSLFNKLQQRNQQESVDAITDRETEGTLDALKSNSKDTRRNDDDDDDIEVVDEEISS